MGDKCKGITTYLSIIRALIAPISLSISIVLRFLGRVIEVTIDPQVLGRHMRNVYGYVMC